ncbi:MAG: DUF6250 domain-containing protein [Opitutaceae bacterium]
MIALFSILEWMRHQPGSETRPGCATTGESLGGFHYGRKRLGVLIGTLLVVGASLVDARGAVGDVERASASDAPTRKSDATRRDGTPLSPDPRFAVAEELVRDDFHSGLALWRTELAEGGTVAASDGVLEIDVPGGCSVWLAQTLEGPVLISYEATAVAAGGPNDRVSDLNCFWMADDARSPGELFATKRTGVFADYDQLRCYYVGFGGNANTTTRFRRYIGERGNRPLLPEHDLAGVENLLVPNVAQRIQIVAAGSAIAFHHNGRRLFAYGDPAPYTRGGFAFRTVKSHLRIRDFHVYRLVSASGAVQTAKP